MLLLRIGCWIPGYFFFGFLLIVDSTTHEKQDYPGDKHHTDNKPNNLYCTHLFSMSQTLLLFCSEIVACISFLFLLLQQPANILTQYQIIIRFLFFFDSDLYQKVRERLPPLSAVQMGIVQYRDLQLLFRSAVSFRVRLFKAAGSGLGADLLEQYPGALRVLRRDCCGIAVTGSKIKPAQFLLRLRRRQSFGAVEDVP